MTQGHEGHEGPGWRRPDASMSLLSDLFAGKVLDPGYAEAAARRRAAGADGAARHGPLARGGVPLVLVLVGLLIVVAGAEVRRGEPAAAEQRARLVAEIRERTARTDALQRRLDALREETHRRRADALARSDAGRRARQGLAVAAGAAAATEVSGPALVLTLDDAPRAEPGDGGPDEDRVYDQDLQVLVNGLWAAGATAIGVNGQRLTPTTAIRTAGEAILVDYRPLGTPYEITGVTAPGRGQARLREAFEGSAADRRARLLRERYGIRYDVRSRDRARLPASGTLRPRYAREGDRP